MANINESKFWKDLLGKILEILLKGGTRRRRRKNTHNQHVVPHEDGWAVKGEGNERYTGVYSSQERAIRRAREIAENYGSDIIIHRRDGTIRDRRSY